MTLRAVGLRCEHRAGIPCVDVAAPRLRWALSGDSREQTAYQIQVDGHWDSGIVHSGQSLEVRYAGPELQPARTYSWRARVWDEHGEPGPWSEPAAWHTGITWTAPWIAHDLRGDPGVVDPAVRYGPTNRRGMPPAPVLRRTFSAEVAPALLYVTARGLAVVELNGERVDDAELVPGWTDYVQRQTYHVVDVTRLLRPGENVLTATLADGWYSGFVGSDPRRPGNLYGRHPWFRCELHVDGVFVVGTDEHWVSGYGPVRGADLLRGESYDASVSLVDSRAVLTREHDGVPMVADRGEPVRVTKELVAQRIDRVGEDRFIVDFGQNLVGRLRVRVPARETLRLRHAEALSEGELYRDNLRTADAEDIVVAGDIDEVYEPRFTVHGFRYAEIQGSTAPPDVVARVLHTDMPRAGRFRCSDELVNKLWSNIEWGLRGNVVGLPTDCPQRDERMGWLADAQVFAPTAALIMDVSAFFTRWLDDVLDAQSEEGVYPDVAPKVPTTRDGAPAWADAGVILPWLLYRTYGDTDILRRHWSAMDSYLGFLRRNNPDLRWRHRRHNDYGDWLSAGEDTSRDLVAAAYWAHDAALMAEMAEVLGKAAAAAEYRKLRADLVEVFRADHLDADGRVTGDTQTGYALALGMDLVPEELRSRAAAHLAANIERHGGHLTTGFLGVGLLCPVLAANGYGDLAHRLLTNRTYPSWGYTIDRGATTIWERWNGWTDEEGFASAAMNSFNHYSLGSVGAWLIEGVAGIRSAAPGYERIVIAPVPGPLTWAEAEYESPRGTIRSSWRCVNERFTLEATVPPGVSARVVLPGGEEVDVGPGRHRFGE
ncbi:alpha-L-rhamnosidase [Amycolatopsis bartoniae]|uniref:alpha-L-rhamnosidase n=1 Tax=Amycolatopsis bartoniae TaxID=941986 RepID=A0A8H9MEY6_9PSEU|nr:family 78 glycoside hydrolase catalytic domain [Amycolatopsis bartoniae]MBB2938914.1 alpha-L-rhamnosidase [Amycolatopsis bartoniae]TVT11272.1 Bacterial alpha-L-rhamnosidase [Amycolatopsis bartoniae]GHF66191.1 alpha-L-rhamnosidase [Amycolatopsis bartoniae]